MTRRTDLRDVLIDLDEAEIEPASGSGSAGACLLAALTIGAWCAVVALVWLIVAWVV